jgi:hypothetical protein
MPHPKSQIMNYSMLTFRFLKAFALLFLLFPLLTNASTASNIHSAGDTLYVNSDILIPENDSMIIEAGKIVLFTGHYSIHVQGKLIAVGTQADTIVFTVADTTGFSDIHSNAGGWNGIKFEDTPAGNDSSLFDYCRFEYGKAVGDSANRYGGAIRLINFNKVRISNCDFSDNYSFYWGGSIYAQKANIEIENCLFENNYSGNDSLVYGYGGAVCFVSSNPDISHSRFYNNSSTGVGGGISFEYSNPSMINCIFTGNYSALGGGIGFLRCSPDRSLANVLVNNNAALYFGGGIANITASPRLSNFTITGNTASMGGGYYCNDYADAKLNNSILWGNFGAGGQHGSQVWIWDVYSEPGFFHCNIQYGSEQFGGSTFIGQYVNNIDDDPLFINPQEFNYQIAQYSPCINTGTPDTSGLMLPTFDLALNPRIMHNMIDIGAYEYDGPLGNPVLQMLASNVEVSPNPVTQHSVISFQTEKPGTVSISLRTAKGDAIGVFNYRANHSGIQQLALRSVLRNPENLPEGIYFVEIRTASQYGSAKILIN